MVAEVLGPEDDPEIVFGQLVRTDDVAVVLQRADMLTSAPFDGGTHVLRRDGGEVVCPDCHPRKCARCESWTHETGLGAYPLCTDCQSEYGGMTNEPLVDDSTEQQKLQH